MHIPYKRAHPRQTIKNYVVGDLKRYVRINTEELNFLKIKNSSRAKCFVRNGGRFFPHQNFRGNYQRNKDTMGSIEEQYYQNGSDAKGTLSLRMSACLSAHVGFRVAGKIGMSAGALPDWALFPIDKQVFVLKSWLLYILIYKLTRALKSWATNSCFHIMQWCNYINIYT